VIDRAAEARVDRALIARVLATDDRRAFEQLVRRHQGMVRAQLRRLVGGDAAQADDLAQETFVRAWRKLGQFRGEARFSTWLYRIAYSCFLQARRKRPPLPDIAAARPPPAEPIDLRLDIAQAMGRLSPGEQAVLLHCVQMGLSHEEAAYVLAMPLGTVKSHAARGKARLRAWLADWRGVDFQEQTS
jgi:RNA polymerase sigma-70 factor (ECF subfamily)